jgi:hypothetical protein
LTFVKQYSQIVGKNYAKNALSQSYRKMTELSMQSSYYSSCPCIERASKMSWRKRKEREEKSFFYEKGNFISSKKKLFSAAVAETATSVQSSSIGKSASQALGKLNGHSVGRSVGRSDTAHLPRRSFCDRLPWPKLVRGCKKLGQNQVSSHVMRNRAISDRGKSLFRCYCSERGSLVL